MEWALWIIAICKACLESSWFPGSSVTEQTGDRWHRRCRRRRSPLPQPVAHACGFLVGEGLE